MQRKTASSRRASGSSARHSSTMRSPSIRICSAGQRRAAPPRSRSFSAVKWNEPELQRRSSKMVSRARSSSSASNVRCGTRASCKASLRRAPGSRRWGSNSTSCSGASVPARTRSSPSAASSWSPLGVAHTTQPSTNPTWRRRPPWSTSRSPVLRCCPMSWKTSPMPKSLRFPRRATATAQLLARASARQSAVTAA